MNFILSLLLVTAPWVLATSFYPQPFSESVQGAPIIVRGKIGMIYTDWSKTDAGGKRIYTFYELQPSEVLKGDLNDTPSITLRELGGEKDGVGFRVPGVAQFETGEDTLVFLKGKNSTGTYDIQGMMMGKYSLQKDEDGTETLTGMGLNQFNNSSFPENPAVEKNLGSTAPAKKWTLSNLRQLIQDQSISPSSAQKSTPTPLQNNGSPPPKLTSPLLFNAMPSHQPTENTSPSSSSNQIIRWASLTLVFGIFALRYIVRKRKNL